MGTKKLNPKIISKHTGGANYIFQRDWSPGSITVQTALYSLPLEHNDKLFINIKIVVRCSNL